METLKNIFKNILIGLFIMAVILIGSIDMDMTERNMRNGNAEVSTSAMIEINI